MTLPTVCDNFLDIVACIGRSTSLSTTVMLGTIMVLPMAMIYTGIKYLDDCPKEPRVPQYLLIGGCFSLLKVISNLWRHIRARRYERLDEFYDQQEESHAELIVSTSSRISEAALSGFLLVWFILGNYWIALSWKPDFVQQLHDPCNWCHERVYMFAIIQILTSYATVALLILWTIVKAIYKKIRKSCC